MDHVWIPLLSALAGALIGSISSIATIIVRSRYEDRRDRSRLAFEAAIEDHKAAIDLAKVTPGRKAIAPLSAFIYYHARIIELLSETNLSKDTLAELDKEMDEVRKVFDKK